MSETLLEKYTSGPDQLQEAVAGLSATELDYRLLPEQWPIRMIVHHVADGEPVYNFLIKSAIAVPGARVTLDWYPGNEPYAAALDHAHRSISQALTLYRACVMDIAAVLSHLPEAWECPLIFAGSEGRDDFKMSVAEMVAMLCEHLQEHLHEIAALKDAQTT